MATTTAPVPVPATTSIAIEEERAFQNWVAISGNNQNHILMAREMLLKAFSMENETNIPDNVSDEFYSILTILKERYRNDAIQNFIRLPIPIERARLHNPQAENLVAEQIRTHLVLILKNSLTENLLVKTFLF